MTYRSSLALATPVALVSFAVLWSAPAPVFRGPPKTTTNSIGMKLAYIPPGKFPMGSHHSEQGRVADEGPEHEVKITKGFHLGVYEVTQGEYEQVMGTNPSCFAATGHGKDKVMGLMTNRFPVEMVSWEEAKEFCTKLSALKGEKGRVYRLTTEAEWEYACRGGATPKTPFHFGKSLSSNQANLDGDNPYGGGALGVHLQRTCEVGSFAPNGYGLHDMHGNVSEWCADWYDKGYYGKGNNENPSGPAAVGWHRVFRGGLWASYGEGCRSACRVPTSQAHCSAGVGFRVALVPSE